MAYQCVNRPDRTADVLMTLHGSGWMTNNELADEIGCTAANVRKITQKLVGEGRIESRPDVRYPCRKEFHVL
ncbi:MarR family transcriptional regulator [Natronorubrum halophilum]|uniref:MarR family transcriptional regulator n=1 Tax=Natronorubrum halophilum TaxID=1702106 RepID=UPI000EF69A7A|nr:MarR family transcriptional regulator [Natronorubrum halophilum]